ncbi:MAG TPA: RNA polymerase sigma factor [Terriglobales bacterium]|nr:RNA polymerase sigma factor [Terriglobales bacterium]
MKNETNPATQRQSDMELVRLAQQGDADAFAALFNANKAKVYSLCLRMTSNTAEAEDLTQVAFLQVFRKLGTFRGDSTLSTWLYRVAVNTVLMHFRKKGMRQLSLDEPISPSADAPKREPGKLDDRLSGCVDRIALTRAMRELPLGYRTIFVMHEVQGYEHHEIARLLRCSVGTSKSQLHKAKARMRELLKLKALRRPQTAEEKVPAAAKARQPESVPLRSFESNGWGQLSEAEAA